MGLFDDDELDALLEEVENGVFEPWDLNAQNVQGMLSRCLASEEEQRRSTDAFLRCQILKPALTGKESEIIYLSTEQINKNRQNIKYLFGQVKSVHDDSFPAMLLKEGFIKYDDTIWTKDYDRLFQLYCLGQCIGYISEFATLKEKPDIICATKASDLVPTLSPKDPNFPAWWEAHKAEWENPAE